jgi:hypothetical protein
MNIDKKMLAAAEKKRDLCARFLSLARIEKEDSAHHDILIERMADEEDPQ